MLFTVNPKNHWKNIFGLNYIQYPCRTVIGTKQQDMEDDYKSTILHLRTAGPSITVYLLTGRKKRSVTANTIAEEPIYQKEE
jgi:hypothetical protein